MQMGLKFWKFFSNVWLSANNFLRHIINIQINLIHFIISLRQPFALLLHPCKSRCCRAPCLYVCVLACEIYLLIIADSESPLAVKCVWISMCVMLLVFWAPFCLLLWGKISEYDRTWGDLTMAKDTYCVGRTDTHVHNKQMCAHTHTRTQHLRLLASGSVLCPSECVWFSETHLCQHDHRGCFCVCGLSGTHTELTLFSAFCSFWGLTQLNQHETAFTTHFTCATRGISE